MRQVPNPRKAGNGDDPAQAQAPHRQRYPDRSGNRWYQNRKNTRTNSTSFVWCSAQVDDHRPWDSVDEIDIREKPDDSLMALAEAVGVAKGGESK